MQVRCEGLTWIFLDLVAFQRSQKGMGATKPAMMNQFRAKYSALGPISRDEPTSPHNETTEKLLVVVGHDHAPPSAHRFSMLWYIQ